MVRFLFLVLILQTQVVLGRLKSEYCEQFDLTGPDNIWIMKPGGLSRGRGIKVYKSLTKMLDFFKNKDTPWVVQKYIENPLVVTTQNGAIRKVLSSSSDLISKV